MKIELKLIPLLEPLRPEIEQVERMLHDTIAQAEEPLRSMLRHALGGGKWLRSTLVILIGQAFAASIAPFHNLAAAVEMLHTATLIHDDVVDKAPLRRGRATLHTLWTIEATVLVGDYLLARSAALVADLASPRIMRVFAEMLCILCAGEIRQMFVTRGKHSQCEDYYRSVEAKTASLFAATTEMASILAGAEEAHIVALRCFGHELGMAFQIMDDVLDFTGSEVQLGKPAGSDLRQGLVTLPTLYYLERVPDDTAVHAVLAGQRDEEHLRAALEAVRSSGAIEDALTEAQAYARQSQAALAALPASPARQALWALAGYVVERRH